MHSEDVEYDCDGTRLVGHLVVPDGAGAGAGVLVCHEAPGLDDHARSQAHRIADELGHVAFAVDYIGDGRVLTDMAEVGAHLGPMFEDPTITRALGRAGLDVLAAHERVDPARLAAIGYCFGGTMALELARGGTDLGAVVGFHSGLGTARPDDASAITAPILVCIGADDPIIPPEQRSAFEDEMRAGGVDWQMLLFGGAGHSFTNPAADERGIDGIAYDEAADRRSWKAMVELFAETIG